MAEIGQSHFLGGSPLNRLSWLRNSPAFLTVALESPKAKWIVFYDGQPLITSTPSPNQPTRKQNTLTRLPTSTILPLLGPAPYFAQGQTPGTSLPAELITTSHNGAGKFLESARLHGPPIVFLGTLEDAGDGWTTRPASDFSLTPEKAEDILGEPYFALDVTEIERPVLESVLNLGKERDGGVADDFADPRAAGLSLQPEEASIFSTGRTMVDWNSRCKYCPSCGSDIYSIWGGWKLSCSSLLPWADNTGKKVSPCPTSKGLHNVMHPRTDAVVITAVLDETGEKILLGRNKRFPPGFYSTLAGFLEPSESFEDAVAREIWEESGVHVTHVRYHSCQPWPFPANLMVGCFAIADASQVIRTDLDNELEDARWFTREEVLAILNSASGTQLKDKELRRMGKDVGDSKLLAPSEDPKDPKSETKPAEEDREEGSASTPLSRIRVPAKTAIAGVLIWKFAHRELDGLGYNFTTNLHERSRI